MVARELPDLFDVARDLLVAMIDVEAIVGLRRSPAAQRVEEPVGSRHILPGYPQYFPPAGQDLVRGAEQLPYVLGRDGVQGPGRKRRPEARDPGEPGRHPAGVARI